MGQASATGPRTALIQRYLFSLLLGLLAVLAATGVWLTFTYRPSTVAAWNVPTGEEARRHISPVRVVHFWSAFAALLGGIAVLAVTVIRRLQTADRRQPAALAAVAVPVLVLLTLTGFLLPWDQLALWAVTVNGDFAGVLKAAFDHQVRFVLIGDAEVGQGAYRAALVAHALVLPTVLAAVIAAQRWRKRSSDSVR